MRRDQKGLVAIVFLIMLGFLSSSLLADDAGASVFAGISIDNCSIAGFYSGFEVYRYLIPTLGVDEKVELTEYSTLDLSVGIGLRTKLAKGSQSIEIGSGLGVSCYNLFSGEHEYVKYFAWGVMRRPLLVLRASLDRAFNAGYYKTSIKLETRDVVGFGLSYMAEQKPEEFFEKAKAVLNLRFCQSKLVYGEIRGYVGVAVTNFNPSWQPVWGMRVTSASSEISFEAPFHQPNQCIVFDLNFCAWW